ncbi:MAG: transcription-repair coupling factor [Deltaproteobacteria bacterium]|nr:transcription-repair coupling factor [Deltaproteobacteria bacterium]
MSLLSTLPAFHFLKESHFTFCGARASSHKAYLLNLLHKKYETPFLILCSNDTVALSLFQDLLFFHKELKDIVYFPGWEKNIPSLEECSQRSESLYYLLRHNPAFIITSYKGLSQRTVPASFFMDYVLSLSKNQNIQLEEVCQKLLEMGYSQTALVDGPGLYSLRGYILDVYPPHKKNPFRIELFDETIESVRSFDPESQKSLEEFDEVSLIPSREIILNKETLQTFQRKFKAHADINNIPKKIRDEKSYEFKNRIFFHGIEAYLPFLYEENSYLFDYLPKKTLAIINEPWMELVFESPLSELKLDPYDFYLKDAELKKQLNEFSKVSFQDISQGLDQEIFFPFQEHDELKQRLKSHLFKKETPLEPLFEHLELWEKQGLHISLVCQTEQQKQRLLHLLKSSQREWNIPINIGLLSSGFIISEEKIVYLTDEEIFGHRTSHSIAKKRKENLFDLQQLEKGDFVIHEHHGLGCFQGLKKLTAGGITGDFALLEYSNHDKLYLPVHRLNLIQKYVGKSAEHILLDQLGSSKWKEKKKKASEDAEKLAHELLTLYAKRKAAEGFSFSAPDALFEEFESTFVYEETPDQIKCIQEVLEDMMQDTPMERLICGDVGFGKTEVALRAAFKAICDKKQVAFLVPTTLLAEQHYHHFLKRFENFPVRVGHLSRFVAKFHQKKTVEDVSSGKIDILIGTHRILSKDIEFLDLGLLIIDEEHRFGVKQKEKIKNYKESIDVLTLTATPIPRTLHMALTNIKNISIMTTPPKLRQPIQTYIVRFDEKLIREAILREIGRGGQVFFLHNRVQSIKKVTSNLESLVPEAKIEYAHGQMDEKDLEKRMHRFLNGEFQVLVCTTIIGSGIDMSNCNTILIHQADKFGLADLYQLRGRVGRSPKQSYCYLLIPQTGTLSEDARRRLSAIEHHTQLGSGFNIASCDLEIRGEGSLLGSKQAGHISSVGLEMYSKLLEEAVNKLQGTPQTTSLDPELNIPEAAYLPTSYVQDENLRLSLYKKISRLESEAEVTEMEGELIDRFGPLPFEANNLLKLIVLKRVLQKYKVVSLQASQTILKLEFSQGASVNHEKVLRLVHKQPSIYKLRGSYELSVCLENFDLLALTKTVTNLLREICAYESMK